MRNSIFKHQNRVSVLFSQHLKNYWVVVIIAVALLLQWYSQSSGLLLTPDSQHYVAGRDSFRNTLSLIDNDGYHFLFWPPLFSIILSFLGSDLEGMIWINMILEILIAWVVMNIANRIILHPGTRLLYFTFILLGVHMLLISSFLWSELIFLFFTTVFIDQLLKSRENRSAFYFALVSGFLMCLQRNAGMFIATGAAIWVFMQEEEKTQSLLKALFLFLCVSSGLVIWNVYVWFSFVPHQYYNFSDKLFQHGIQNIESIAHALVNTFLPIKGFHTPTLIIAFFCLVYFLKDEIRRNVSLQLVFIITVVYLIYLCLVVIINVSGYQVDVGEADRFISVIIPFLGILVFRSYEKALEAKSATVRALMMLLVCCWMSYPLARTIKNALQWHEVSKGSVDR